MISLNNNATKKKKTMQIIYPPPMAALKKTGRIFNTAPTSIPPALRPSRHIVSGDVNLLSIKYSAHAIRSVKVFFFFKNLVVLSTKVGINESMERLKKLKKS